MSLFFRKISYKTLQLEDVVRYAQYDDIQALKELIKREQKSIYSTLYYLSQDKDELFDDVQEILFKMCKNLKNLKNPKAFRSWLNRIIMHYYYDVIRRKNKIPQTVPVENINQENEVYNTYENLLADKKKKPDESVLLKELDTLITHAVKNLPEQLKIAIILREFQGLSYDEIANVTNTNIGTVKSRIARARVKLQRILRNYLR